MKIYFLLYRNGVFPPSHVSFCGGCRFSLPICPKVLGHPKWVDGNLVSRHFEPRVAAGTHRFLWFCNALGPVTTLAEKRMENLPEWTIFRWIFLRNFLDLFFWIIFFPGCTIGFIIIKQPNWDHIFWEFFPSVFIANPRVFMLLRLSSIKVSSQMHFSSSYPNSRSPTKRYNPDFWVSEKLGCAPQDSWLKSCY